MSTPSVVDDIRRNNEAIARAGLKPLLTRFAAADFVSTAIGANFSEMTLRRSACPYRIIQRQAMYDEADLIAFVQKLRAEAPIRRGSSTKKSSGLAGGSGPIAA